MPGSSLKTCPTAAYRQVREGIRQYYRAYYPLLFTPRSDILLNPSSRNVSHLCHEPRVSLAVLEQLLAPYRAGLQFLVLLRHKPVAAETQGDLVSGVSLLNLETNESISIEAAYFLDATELGDLLPMTGTEFVIGAESQSQTGELHAREDAPDPLEQQPFTWCFSVDYLEGEDCTIEKPAEYEFWRQHQADFWPDRLLSWTYSDPMTLNPITRPIFTQPRQVAKGTDLCHYRRIFYTQHYPQGMYPSDIVVVNWPANDYWLSPLVGVPEEQVQKNIYMARQLSYSLMYWMQTEAPRMDGGYGYRGLRLRGDINGTTDGLAKAAYIRESRRIQAEFTVREQHIGLEMRGDLKGAEVFQDSVGIGTYRIDLHPTYRRNYVDITSWPFQIPLGALLPVRMNNLLPACKNLGVTHITNGCYRVHSSEWNIGESAGTLAAFCLEKRVQPRQVRNVSKWLIDFQKVLTDQGVQLAWPEEIRLTPRTKLDALGY